MLDTYSQNYQAESQLIILELIQLLYRKIKIKGYLLLPVYLNLKILFLVSFNGLINEIFEIIIKN